MEYYVEYRLNGILWENSGQRKTKFSITAWRGEFHRGHVTERFFSAEKLAASLTIPYGMGAFFFGMVGNFRVYEIFNCPFSDLTYPDLSSSRFVMVTLYLIGIVLVTMSRYAYICIGQFSISKIPWLLCLDMLISISSNSPYR